MKYKHSFSLHCSFIVPLQGKLNTLISPAMIEKIENCNRALVLSGHQLLDFLPCFAYIVSIAFKVKFSGLSDVSKA